jgi:hypothetical protein
VCQFYRNAAALSLAHSSNRRGGRSNLVHHQPPAANRVQHLRRARDSSSGTIDGRPSRGAQRVILALPLIRRQVAEHLALLLLLSTHAFSQHTLPLDYE